jgi:hypothetical protein
LRWESHEQELMNFSAEEYDAGASLSIHPCTSQPSSISSAHSMRRRGATLSYSNFEFKSRTFNIVRMLETKGHAYT